MPDIYGNDFGNLQGNVTADAALRSRTMESALQNALGALTHATDRRQRAEELTQQLTAHAADQDKLLKAHQPLVDAQVKYYDWLTKQPSSVQEKDRALDEAYLDHISKTGGVDSDEDANFLAPNASPTARRIAVRQSLAVQGQLDNERSLAEKLSGTMTNKAQLEQLLSGAIDPEDPNKVKLRKGLENNPQIRDWQDRLTAINKTLKPYQDNKLIDKLVIPSLSQPGTYEPAVGIPAHRIRQQNRVPQNDTGIEANPLVLDNPGRPAAPIDEPGATNTAPMLRRPVSLGMVSRPSASANDTGIEANPLPDVTMPTDNPPARPITTTGTAAPAGGSDYKTWVIGRAKQYTDKGFDPTIAITRARAEYNALFQ